MTTELDTLDRIALEASGMEQAADAAEHALVNPEPEAPLVDPAATWAVLPKMFGGILAIAMPELQKEYTDERCQAWGGAMAMVAEKHGWDAAETMTKWGPEIALCMATMPLAIPTIAAIKARKVKDDKKKAEPKEEPAAVAVDQLPAGGNFDEPK